MQALSGDPHCCCFAPVHPEEIDATEGPVASGAANCAGMWGKRVFTSPTAVYGVGHHPLLRAPDDV